MPTKSESNVWDKLAEKGFFYHTDPKKYGPRTAPPDEVKKAREDSNIVDKTISVALDTPVTASASAGSLLGVGAQKLTEGIQTVGSKIPIINKIDDGIKVLDKSQVLSDLSKGRLPGSKLFGESVNNGVDRVKKMGEAPWIGKVAALPATLTAESIKLIMPEPWDKLVDNITLGITARLLDEMAQVLIDWYKDPKTLCCLIKNLGALGSVMRERDFSSENWTEEKNKMFKGMSTANSVSNDVRATLVKILEYVDLVIDILDSGVDDFLNFAFDPIKELSDALVGMFVGILDALIAAGKESYMDRINEVFDGWNQYDNQCLPFQRLLDVLRRFFTSDHGLFRLLERYINEYMKYLKWRFKQEFEKKFFARLKVLAFLIELRKLLIEIIKALRNFEICVEADYSIVNTDNPLSSYGDSNSGSGKRVCPYGVPADTTDNWIKCAWRTETPNNILCEVDDQIPGKTSYCNHPQALTKKLSDKNDTKYRNIGKLTGEYPGVGKIRIGDTEEIGVVFPTDNEVRNFLVNRLGYSKDNADQMVAESQSSVSESKIETRLDNIAGIGDSTGTTSDGRPILDKDHINKKLEVISALGDCAKSLDPQKIAELVTRVSDIL